MAYETEPRQIEKTVKILCLLAANPKIQAKQLARSTGVSANYVARILSAAREAGIDIEYDFSKQQYVGKFSEQFQQGIFKGIVEPLRRELNTEPREIASLKRWNIDEFIEQIYGTTPNNVYNMIAGHKGAQLPQGWIAYQLRDRKWWLVQMMQKGKRWVVPPVVEEYAITLVQGPAGPPATKFERPTCPVVEDGEKCGDNIVARGLCSRHYTDARRHPNRYRQYMKLRVS